MVGGAILMLTAKLSMKKARTVTLTVGGAGKVVFAQLYLMHLAGLVLNWRCGRVEDPTEEQITANRRKGYKALKNVTKEDFGLDAERWFEFFTTHSDKYRFTYPEGYAIMRGFLEERGHNLPWNEDIEPAG